MGSVSYIHKTAAAECCPTKSKGRAHYGGRIGFALARCTVSDFSHNPKACLLLQQRPRIGQLLWSQWYGFGDFRNNKILGLVFSQQNATRFKELAHRSDCIFYLPHCAHRFIISLRSPTRGSMTSASHPAATYLAAHASLARLFAPQSSFSPRIVIASIPARTGKVAMAPTEPNAHVGPKPSWRADRQLSIPSPIIRPSTTSAPPSSFIAAALARPNILR